MSGHMKVKRMYMCFTQHRQIHTLSDSVDVSDLRARDRLLHSGTKRLLPGHKHVQTGADPDPGAFERPEVQRRVIMREAARASPDPRPRVSDWLAGGRTLPPGLTAAPVSQVGRMVELARVFDDINPLYRNSMSCS
ncbi:hypothetical protein E1301_Tti023011 [Triplophysa tibetana]|uniref:Uncharacterized protein n=1 Tax=Triplophysa tibetana TaxID=1572043 RepID=A0A5A9PF77_9TELE|nr:hypothetical protein E1301_Tti023011 [Triplophysa tibetana]